MPSLLETALLCIALALAAGAALYLAAALWETLLRRHLLRRLRRHHDAHGVLLHLDRDGRILRDGAPDSAHARLAAETDETALRRSLRLYLRTVPRQARLDLAP